MLLQTSMLLSVLWNTNADILHIYCFFFLAHESPQWPLVASFSGTKITNESLPQLFVKKTHLQQKSCDTEDQQVSDAKLTNY